MRSVGRRQAASGRAGGWTDGHKETDYFVWRLCGKSDARRTQHTQEWSPVGTPSKAPAGQSEHWLVVLAVHHHECMLTLLQSLHYTMS